MKLASTIVVLAGLATASSASLTVTEAFVGLSGEDGTQDWIEFTNTTNGVVDTGNFWYDDDSADFGDAGRLDSILLGAGESAIFLLGDAAIDDVTYANAIEEFQAIWSYSGAIGHTNGGGALGQGGDAIVLFDNMGTVISTTVTPESLSGNLETIDYVNGAAASVLGVNGAYASMAFFNDNLGLPGDSAVLIGSPGIVPAPGALAMLALGGLVGARRRR
jgi:MYXO-CTERM domain-containing protein